MTEKWHHLKGEESAWFFVKLVFEIAVAQQTKTRDRTFKGAGGVFIKISLKSTFKLFLIEGSDSYRKLFTK